MAHKLNKIKISCLYRWVSLFSSMCASTPNKYFTSLLNYQSTGYIQSSTKCGWSSISRLFFRGVIFGKIRSKRNKEKRMNELENPILSPFCCVDGCVLYGMWWKWIKSQHFQRNAIDHIISIDFSRDVADRTTNHYIWYINYAVVLYGI